MRRCVQVNPSGRRCWAVAYPSSHYCDIHAPASEEFSFAKGLESVTERYNAVGSFLDNYWAGEQLRVEDFLEATELAMGLAEVMGARPVVN